MGVGLKPCAVAPWFHSCVKLPTVRKGAQEPQLISLGITGNSTSRNYHQRERAEEDEKGGLDSWWLTSKGLRCQVGGKRQVQSRNELNKRLLIMIPINKRLLIMLERGTGDLVWCG